MAFKKVGALWPLKSGKPGYSGMLSEPVSVGRIFVFPNKNRKSEKQPEIELFISIDDPKGPEPQTPSDSMPF